MTPGVANPIRVPTGRGCRRRARRAAVANRGRNVEVLDRRRRVHYTAAVYGSGRIYAWIHYPAPRRRHTAWPAKDYR